MSITKVTFAFFLIFFTNHSLFGSNKSKFKEKNISDWNVIQEKIKNDFIHQELYGKLPDDILDRSMTIENNAGKKILVTIDRVSSTHLYFKINRKEFRYDLHNLSEKYAHLFSTLTLDVKKKYCPKKNKKNKKSKGSDSEISEEYEFSLEPEGSGIMADMFNSTLSDIRNE